MNQTTDINTAAVPAPVAIADLQGLTNTVNRLASLQLILNQAEAEQQAAQEAAKKGFADATAPFLEEMNALFAGLEKYCGDNKDTLFPTKGGKRAKTFAVLQHKLQYRSSQSVLAPATAADQILATARMLETKLISEQAKGDARDSDAIDQVAAVITVLNGLIRPSAAELKKDAVKEVTNEQATELLLAMGIKVVTEEAFKLSFNFSPQS